MLRSTQTMQLRAAAFPGIVDANKAIIGVSYVAAYVALDWVSFIEPYGLDRSNRTSTAFERIVKQTIELCQPDLDRASVTARFDLAADLPPVMVDILQIEQVLLNSMRNSIEAISDTARRHGSILIEAKLANNKFVEVRLFDSGPGFPREHIENGLLPLSSTKPDGLGAWA